MIILELPWALSTNTMYRAYGNRTILSKKGREYKKVIISEVHRQLGGIPEPILDRLHVHATFYPPDKRKRDLDNHWKSLLDSLTQAHVWEDDSQIDVLNATRGEVLKPGKVIIEINSLF